MERRAFLQGLGLVVTSAGTTYGFARPKVRPPKGVYVQMGSSVTAGLHAPWAFVTPVVVGSRLNLTPVNVGFDGACAGVYDCPIASDDLSLCKLVDAIISGDWSAQERAVSVIGNGNEASLLKIKATDFSQVTHIGLEYGTNDFSYCAPLETFKGWLAYSVQKLLASFPKARLFLITPAWRLNFEELDSDTRPNESGIFLKQYVDAMVEVAVSKGVPCLNMWRTLGINAINYKNFTADGTHPNETGARIRGEVIASFISSAF